jgi:hypothetical protein
VTDFISPEKVFKSAVSIAIFVPLVGIELSPMIGHHLANRCQLSKTIQSLLEEFDAVFRCLRIEFPTRKNAPRAVIEEYANLFAVALVDVPIEMYRA